MALRGGRFIGSVFSHGALAVTTIGLGLVALVSAAPIDAPWLARDLERRASVALSDHLAGAGLAIDGAEIATGSGVQIRLRGVALQRPGREEAALRAQSAVIGLDPVSALSGQVRLSRIAIEGGRLSIVRLRDGAVRVALDHDALTLDAPEASEAEPSDDADALEPDAAARRVGDPRAAVERATAAAAEAVSAFAEQIAGAVRLADADAEDGVLADRVTLALSSIDLRVVDAASGRVWTADDAALAVEVDGADVSARLEAQVNLSRGGRVAVQAVARRAAGAGVVELSARLVDADIGALWRETAAAASEAGFAFAGRADISVSAIVDAAASALARAEIATTAADLELTAPGLGARILDEATVAVSFEPQSRRAEIERLRLLGQTFVLDGTGRLDLAAADGGGLRSLIGAVELDRLEIAEPELFPERLVADAGRLSFDIDFQSASVAAPSVELETADAVLRGSGAAFFGAPEGGTYLIRFEAEPFDATSLPRLWPALAAPGARLWVTENIRSGRVDRLRFDAVLEPRGARIDGAFDVSAVEATFLEGMPPIEDGVGSGRVTAERFDFDLSAGRVSLGAAGELTLGASTFSVPRFSPAPAPSETLVRASGPLRAVLALLDRPPLRLIERFDRDLGDPTGDVDAEVRLAFPLAAGLRLADVDVDASGVVQDLALDAPGIDARLRADRADVSADLRGLRVRATARLDGRDVEVDWRERFRPDRGEPRSRLVIDGVVDRARLAELGVSTALHEGGAVGVDGRIDFFAGARGAFDLDLDLDRAQLAIAPLAWRKGPGADGRLRVAGSWRPDGVALDRLDARFGDLTFAGALELGRGGALDNLDLSSVRMRDGADGPVIVDTALALRPGEDGLEARAVGALIDIDRLSARRRALGVAPTPEDAVDVIVALDVDRLLLAGGAELTRASIEGAVSSDGLARIELRAFAGSAPLVARISPSDGGQRYFVSTEDAGGALRGLGLLTEGRGGRLRLSGVAPPDGPARGELQIDDMVVVDGPVMATVLSSAFVLGIIDRAGSGGISLSRVRAPFRVTDDMIFIDEAAASGPALGFTITGAIGRDDERLDLSGSLSPAFAINGILSEIPLLGDIVSGGSGSGLLGVAFTVGGRLGAPEVEVNPLSALTPGPFRRIFSDSARPSARSGRGLERGGSDFGRRGRRDD